MSFKPLAISEIGFDLRQPCSDCPFRRSVKPRKDMAEDLEPAWGKIERGEFLHSCHKTDPDADGYMSTVNGKLQHCAGAIMMLKKEGPEGHQIAWRHFKNDIEAIGEHPDVFNGLVDMIKHYDKWLKGMKK